MKGAQLLAAHEPLETNSQNGERRLKILVVDDRADSVLATSAALSSLKQRIVTAGSGDDALRLLLFEHVDLILLDVRMPGMDGFETAHLIRLNKKYQSTPILFLTGDISPESVSRGYAVGAADYIRKPIEPNDLRARVRAFVDALSKPNHEDLPRVLAVSDQETQLLAVQYALAGLPAKLVLARSPTELQRASVASDTPYALVLLGPMARTSPLGMARRLAEPLRQAHVILMLEQKPERPEQPRTADQAELESIEAPVEPRKLRARLSPFLELHRRAERIRLQEQRLRQLERERAAVDLSDAQARFSSLVGALDELVYTLDAQQRFTAFFGAAGKLPIDPLNWLGTRPQEAWGPSGADAHENAQRQALAGKRAVYEWSLMVGSEMRHYQTSLVPLRGQQGATTGCIGATRDVSDQKLLQLQLMQTDRLASIGMLAAGVAHEINNPLSAVLGCLELMEPALRELKSSAAERDDIEQLEQDVQLALQGVARITRVVADLQLFARPSAEEVARPTDVNAALTTTLTLIANQIRHRAQLVTEFSQIPLTLADENRLGQVFLNLLLNAVQSIPEGHADENRIYVSTALEDAAVVVRIRDTGCGMSPAVLRKLFTPFFTTKQRGSGTGLGLSICKQLVTRYGGDLTIASTEGRGTTVTVSLPRATDTSTAGTRPASHPRTAGGEVLILDDEASVLKVAERALVRDHRVTATTSGKRALEFLSQGARFDVILCDIMMPEMSGLEFYRTVAQTAPDQLPRIVFMTGGAFTEEAREELAKLPNRQIEKPVGVEGLRTVVAEQLIANEAKPNEPMNHGVPSMR